MVVEKNFHGNRHLGDINKVFSQRYVNFELSQ